MILGYKDIKEILLNSCFSNTLFLCWGWNLYNIWGTKNWHDSCI